MHNLHRRVAHELPPACPKTGIAAACPQGVSSPGEPVLTPIATPAPAKASRSSKPKASSKKKRAKVTRRR